MTRRTLLGSSLLTSAAAAWAAPPAGIGEGVCIALCNHWSYIGIGWQLGLESNVLSVVDASTWMPAPTN